MLILSISIIIMAFAIGFFIYHIEKMFKLIKESLKIDHKHVMDSKEKIALCQSDIKMILKGLANMDELNKIKNISLKNEIDKFIEDYVCIQDEKQLQFEERINLCEIQHKNNFDSLESCKELNLKNYEFLVNHCNQTSEKIDKLEIYFENQFTDCLRKISDLEDENDGFEEDVKEIYLDIEKVEKRLEKLDPKITKKKIIKTSK